MTWVEIVLNAQELDAPTPERGRDPLWFRSVLLLARGVLQFDQTRRSVLRGLESGVYRAVPRSDSDEPEVA